MYGTYYLILIDFNRLWSKSLSPKSPFISFRAQINDITMKRLVSHFELGYLKHSIIES